MVSIYIYIYIYLFIYIMFKKKFFFSFRYVLFSAIFALFSSQPFFNTVSSYDAIVIRVIIPYTWHAHSYSPANSTSIESIMPCPPFSSTHDPLKITPSYTPAPVHNVSQNQKSIHSIQPPNITYYQSTYARILRPRPYSSQKFEFFS